MTRIVALIFLAIVPFVGSNATTNTTTNTSTNTSTNTTQTCDVIAKAAVGDVAAVRKMIAAECDLGVRNAMQMTPLAMATLNGHVTVVWLLIQAGADINQEAIGKPLNLAASIGQTEIARLLIEAGAPVNPTSGEAPLHTAAEADHADTIKMLIGKGAMVDVRDRLNRTPLHNAAMNGRAKAVRALVEAKANIDALDNDGKTPLHLTIKDDSSNVPILTATPVQSQASSPAPSSLLSSFLTPSPAPSPEPSPTPTTSPTPSESAADKKVKEIEELERLAATAKVLAKLKAKLDVKDNVTKTVDDIKINITWTPLHYAAFYNRTRMIHALAEVGASLESQDAQGNTPLHIASREGNVEAIRALAEVGASLESQDTQGNTPLHIASKEGSAESIRTLFEIGVNDRVKNTADQLPDEVAAVFDDDDDDDNDHDIRDMIQNPGIYWPVKAYVVGIEESRHSNVITRITCNDTRRCRVFLNCTNEDGKEFHGWIGTLEKEREKTTVDSIIKEATLTFSVSEFRTLVDARGGGALGCALHSHQRVMAQVWSIMDEGNANITSYRLSETFKEREKAPIQFYYGDSSIPYVNIRCINDEERGCISVKLKCFNEKAVAWTAINIGRIRPFGLYTIAGSDTNLTDAGVDHWLVAKDKGWYSCDVASTGPFMVYVTDLISKGAGERYTANATAVSAQ